MIGTIEGRGEMSSRLAWRAIARTTGVVMLAVLALVGVRAVHAVVAQGATPDQITLVLWPAGQGSIDVAQNGAHVATCDFRYLIDNSKGCAVDIAAGVPTTFTATPEPSALLTDAERDKVPDYPVWDPAFVRWTVVGCDGTGPCTYTPDDGDWVGAIFTPLELEVGVYGNGTVTDAADDDRIACDDGVVFPEGALTTCHGLYAADSSVVLAAIPSTDDVGPTTWMRGCDPEGGNPQSARCTVTMTNIRTFAALGFPGPTDPMFFPFPFDILPHVRVALGGSGTGHVTGSGFDCGTQCTHVFTYQDPVTLSAAADPGSHFVGWQGVCSTAPACSFSAGSLTRVRAIFDLTPTPAPPTTSQTTSTPPVVTARAFLPTLDKVRARRFAGHRVVAATLGVDFVSYATLRLLRNGRSIATTHWNLRKGQTLVRLRLPRNVKPGRCQFQVHIVSGSASRTLTTSVTIGR
jgi:Divergent InlB B-repeat domain